MGQSRFAVRSPRRLGRVRCIRAAWLVASALAVLLGLGVGARAEAPVVHVVEIHGEIDMGLVPFVNRALEDAAAAGAAAVVVDIDTLGGRVDAAVQIRDALLASNVPVVAFVAPRAISAGALIALSATKIAMAEGATMGAAAPVMAAPGGAPSPAGEKAVSYVRKEFRATAEARGRNPELAEAMVDEDVAVKGVIAEGKLLTVTTDEALELELADLRAADLDALLRELDLEGAAVVRAAPNWAEHVVRFLTSGIVSSLLLTLGTLGLLVELRTPGVGVPGLVGLACLALFFWAHWLVNLAGWEEILLVGIGVTLLAVEFFVIPGFGVAGVLGILALFAGMAMSLVGSGVSFEQALGALAQVAVSFVLALVGALVLLRFLPKLPLARRLILATGLGAEVVVPEPSVVPRTLVGARGRAVTPLRPAGIASFDGARVDVVSEGDWVSSGQAIEVVRADGNRVVVRPLTGGGLDETQTKRRG